MKMKSTFKKTALAAAVTGTLTGISMDAQALITGAAGEALLVPLVLVTDTGDDGLALNTIINVSTPREIGLDIVPNVYTAPNVSPFKANWTDPAEYAQSIHWYVFTPWSVEFFNGAIPVSANYEVTINMREVLQPVVGDVAFPVYMIFGNESARDGSAADFALFGNAQLVSEFNGDIVGIADIPVVPMSDGADAAPFLPTMQNEVVYNNVTGIPTAASPLAAGIRTNYTNGFHDQILIDLEILEWTTATTDQYETDTSLWVIWNDRNQVPPVYTGPASWQNMTVYCYNDNEQYFSNVISLPWELNLVVPGAAAAQLPIDSDYVISAGDAGNSLPLRCPAPGRKYATIFLNEPFDVNVAAPGSVGSAAVAFSLLWVDGDLPSGGTYTVPAGQREAFPTTIPW
jgi:hypothetical protein